MELSSGIGAFIMRLTTKKFLSITLTCVILLFFTSTTLIAQETTVEPPTPDSTLTPSPEVSPSASPTSDFASEIATDESPTALQTSEVVLSTSTAVLLSPNDGSTISPSDTASPILATTTASSLLPIYTTNFDNGDLSAWQLGPGWSLVPSEAGQALQIINSAEPAVFSYTTSGNIVVEVRINLGIGEASLNLNESAAGAYHLRLNVNGTLELWRNDALLVSSYLGSTPFEGWHTLRLSVLNGLLRAAVDGNEVIITQDNSPLPAGSLSINANFSDDNPEQNVLRVDDVSVWTETAVLPMPTPIILATLPPPLETSTDTLLATLPPPPTEPLTETATLPTETENATEAGAESTIEAPTMAPSPTTPAAPLPAEPPLTLLFEDNFDTVPLPIWTFGAGWSVVASEGGQALQVVNSDEPTTLIYDNLSDLAAQARFQIGVGAAQLTLRESESGSYRVTLDASGQVNLYRGTLIATTTVNPSTPGQWRILRLLAMKGILHVAVDGVEVIVLQDDAPLPPGKMDFGGIGISTNSLLVDDVALWLPTSSVPASTEMATDDLSSLIPPTPIPYTPPAASPHLFAAPQLQTFNNPQTYLGAEFAIIAPEDVGQLTNPLVLYAGCSLSTPYEIYLLEGIYTLTETIRFICNTSIYGRGAEVTTIAQDRTVTSMNRMMIIDGAITLELHNVTITNGNSDAQGGAVYVWNNSTLGVYDSIFSNNIAQIAGGAIYGQLSTIHIERSIFTNNTGIGSGGGIYVLGTAGSYGSLTGICTNFNNNITQGTSGTFYGSGGAIYTAHVNINMTGGAFDNNEAIGTTGIGKHIYRFPSGSSSVIATGNYWTNPTVPNGVSLGINAGNQLATPPTNCATNLPKPLPNNVIVVDQQSCSLADAIMMANNAGTAPIGSACVLSGLDTNYISDYVLEIEPTEVEVTSTTDGLNGLPTIIGSLVIRSADGSARTIQRDLSVLPFRIFHVAPGASLILNNIIVSGGIIDGDGGGIYNSGRLIIENGGVKQNTASGNGGGIFNSGSLTINNSIISNNQAVQGGAVYADSSATPGIVNTSCITGNSSTSVFAESSVIFNAQQNWWGASSGASTATMGGFTGPGDSVSSNVNYSNPFPNALAGCDSNFTALDLNGHDVSLQGAMFWVIYWETSEDSFDSGSLVDSDLPSRYTEFLFDQQQAYCSPGINPPSDNAAELIVVPDPMDPNDPYWVYIKHCPGDHRFMFARTMINAFLNYERRNEIPFDYVTANNSSVTRSATTNRIWTIQPCQDQGDSGSTFPNALSMGTGSEWLYGYANCVGTNPNVDLSSIAVQRLRRAYNATILPQIREAAANFYDLSATPSDPTTGDPTFGAFSNLDANIQGDTLLSCVGGCYLSKADKDSGHITYTYRASQITQNEFSFAQLASMITQQDILDAYNRHIQQQVLYYQPAQSAVLQPVLRRDAAGYVWSTRVYQRSGDLRHFPRR